MVRRNFLALLQGWHRITLSDNRHVVHKLACLLFQAGAPSVEESRTNLNRMERFPQIIFER